MTKNSKFSNNTGQSISIEKSSYIDLSSTFLNNSNDNGPVIYSENNAVIVLNQTQIINNYASDDGVIYLTSGSVLYSSNLLIENNSAGVKGAGIYSEKNSRFEVSQSIFTRNNAVIGSAIFIQSTTHNSSFVSNSSFFENTAYLSGCIYLIESSLTLLSSNIYKNTAKGAPSIVAMLNSKVYISDCKISSHIGDGAFLSIVSSSLASAFSTTFNNIISDNSDSLIAIEINQSNFSCFNCEFSDIQYQIGSLLSCAHGFCTLNFCKIVDVSASSEGKILNIDPSATLDFSYSTIENFTGISIYLDINCLASVSHSSIICNFYTAGYSISGSGIFCKKCSELSVTHSFFHNLSSEMFGGSFFLNSESNSTFLIADSEFSRCASNSGGAVYIKNSEVSFVNVTFINNVAKSNMEGQGGAIWISQNDESKSVEIKNSIFNHNFAEDSGGAIQWYFLEPTFSNNVFFNNSAVYGPDLASFAMNLSLKLSRSLDTLTFVPGQQFSSLFEVNILDHYGQIVENDFSSKAQLSPTKESNYSILGSSSSTSYKGVLTFGNFTIYGSPGSFSRIQIIPSFRFQPNSVSSLNFDFGLRECIVGEVEESGLKCMVCRFDTYNLKAGTTCKKCPKGGKCFGGNVIVAAAGFWRYSKTSDTFFECPNPSSCLEEIYESAEDNCDTGYKSVCCQSCAPNYSRSFQNMCSKCLNSDQNTALLIALMAFLILVIFGITVSNIKGAYKDECVTSIYYKILMNYTQIITLTSSLNLSWPYFVKKMFEIQGRVVGGYEQIFSVDCFLNSRMEPIYAKLIILSLIPVVCLIISAAFWSIWGKFKKSKNIREKFIGSIIVQFFFFQPNLAELIFSIFNCTELAAGDFYMTEEMSIKCWSGRHLMYSLGLALPSMIIWCIGVPIVLVVLLNKNKSSLDHITEKLKYGFLYKGFEPNKFYWEFIIMLKKMLIISASVFLRNASISAQALVIFIVILLGYALQEKLQPYTSKQLNAMELRAIFVSAVTIYAGLFFITDDLSFEGKVIMFVAMILSNLAFLMYWGYFTFGYYLGTFYKNYVCCKKLFRGKLDNWVTQVVPDTSKEQENKEESIIDQFAVCSL